MTDVCACTRCGMAALCNPTRATNLGNHLVSGSLLASSRIHGGRHGCLKPGRLSRASPVLSSQGCHISNQPPSPFKPPRLSPASPLFSRAIMAFFRERSSLEPGWLISASLALPSHGGYLQPARLFQATADVYLQPAQLLYPQVLSSANPAFSSHGDYASQTRVACNAPNPLGTSLDIIHISGHQGSPAMHLCPPLHTQGTL